MNELTEIKDNMFLYDIDDKSMRIFKIVFSEGNYPELNKVQEIEL